MAPPLDQMEEVLDRLRGDSNLHRVLAEERMRCELHKENYEKLKSEYVKYDHRICKYII